MDRSDGALPTTVSLTLRTVEVGVYVGQGLDGAYVKETSSPACWFLVETASCVKVGEKVGHGLYVGQGFDGA